MDAKLRFVAAVLGEEAPMTVLCERHGISRQTGYVWYRRYLEEGLSGLEERSRAPHGHGRRTSASVIVRLVEARRRKPYWGPKKLLKVLSEGWPEERWPALSTLSEILRREGLSAPRRRRRRALEVEKPFAGVQAANDAWCIDFKGWFRTGNGVRCDPLTVSDAHSRYLLGLRIVPPVASAVDRQLDRLLREYGLPRALRSDNGVPFASHGAGGLSRLSVKWVKLGIELERIYPGQPQQNGRHERMHGTLKREACQPAAATPVAQQKRFDAFRREYNEERPHEALGQRRPAEVWQPSARPYPRRLEDPVYGADEAVRRVRHNGEVKWQGSTLYVSEALVGEPVGIARRADGHWLVRFAHVPLLLIDRSNGKVAGFGPGRPPRSKPPARPA